MSLDYQQQYGYGYSPTLQLSDFQANVQASVVGNNGQYQGQIFGNSQDQFNPKNFTIVDQGQAYGDSQIEQIGITNIAYAGQMQTQVYGNTHIEYQVYDDSQLEYVQQVVSVPEVQMVAMPVQEIQIVSVPVSVQEVQMVPFVQEVRTATCVHIQSLFCQWICPHTTEWVVCAGGPDVLAGG
jgi:hypothetical protein